MPLLTSGADHCVLEPGSYTIGGRGTDALHLSALEWQPAVAVITVPRHVHEPTLIRRITASVVVRLGGNPLGIAAAELVDGAIIEFAGCRLVFCADDSHALAIRSAEPGLPDHETTQAPPGAAAVGARLVNVKTGASFALADRRILIGRDDACDLVLHGQGLSRRHALISPSGNGYVLRDQSANGTKVNGTPLAGARLLVSGDVVEMMDEALRFELEGMPAEAVHMEHDDDGGATQILDLSRIERMTRGLGPGRRMSCSLEVMSSRFDGTLFELDKPVCAIGRGSHNDVVLRDDSVSLTHATLLRKGNVWYVLDLGSANGTWVDGSRASGERAISSGVRLRTGGVEMVFRAYSDGLEESAPPPVRRGVRGVRHWMKVLLNQLS